MSQSRGAESQRPFASPSASLLRTSPAVTPVLHPLHGSGHTPARTPRARPSTKLSAWLWPNWHSWLTPNCHKTIENVLWLLEKDSWRCLKARRAEQTSVVYNKTFEDNLKLKRKIFLLLMNPETICYQLYLLISLIR